LFLAKNPFYLFWVGDKGNKFGEKCHRNFQAKGEI
jgi:hypothetical protein